MADGNQCATQKCKKSISIFRFKCSYCQKEYCTKHRLPEEHSCESNFKEKDKLKECLEKQHVKDSHGYIQF